jgi:hypothetical protein
MITKELENTLNLAVAEATARQHEYVTLEHLLLALLNDPTARDVIYHCGGNLDSLKKEVQEFFAAHSEMVSADPSTLPEQTIAFQQVLQYEDDKLHRGEIVIMQKDPIKRWPLELRLALGLFNNTVFKFMHRHTPTFNRIFKGSLKSETACQNGKDGLLT